MDQFEEHPDLLPESGSTDQVGYVINDTLVKDITSNLCNVQIDDTLSIASCHVASRTTKAKSSDIATRARGNASAWSSDVAIVSWCNKEEGVLDLGNSEFFDPLSSEVYEIERGTCLGRNFLRS